METDKSYELRDLCSKDIFPMSKIISKIGIKEFKGIFESEDVKNMIQKVMKKKNTDADKVSDADMSSVGISIVLDIVDIILSNLSSCEDYIYMLLSGLSGMSKKEISELPMSTFVAMIIDVIKKEEFKGFTKAVSKLIK